MLVFGVIGDPLNTPEAPAGIISYEFAGNMAQVDLILESWDAYTRQFAAFALGLDYLYMPAYAVTISLACLWAGRWLSKLAWPFHKLSAWFAWGVWFAAGLDAIENFALAVLLFGFAREPWPQVAAISASFKFGFLIIGLLYFVYGVFAAVKVGTTNRLERENR